MMLAICLSPLGEKLSERSPAYRAMWNVVSLLYIVVIPFDLERSGLVLAVAHLVIFIQVVKLLNRKANADYVQMYLMSFFKLLSASVLTKGLVFSVALVSFTVAAVWTLVLFHFKIQLEDAASGAGAAVQPRQATEHRRRGSRLTIVDASLVTTNIAVTLAAVLLMSAFFYAIPRLEAGLFSRTQEIEQIGFTEEVELATYGNVFSDSSVVMRVEMPQFAEGLPAEPYWRAMALDHYDGERWVKRESSRRAGRADMFGLHPDTEGAYEPRPIPPDSDLIEQIIYLDSLDTSYLFGLNEMKRVVGDFGRLLYDPNDNSWVTRGYSKEGLRYRAYSLLPDFDPERLRRSADVYPDALKTAFIEQLPEDLDPRIYDLASEITKSATNSYDKAIAVESHLRSNYLYRLVPPAGTSEAPLEYFLFQTGVGHCEFFATSMAVLLRCSGVPARLASGFRGGQWNELSRFYSVRQDYAHVWVEVFFREFGWVPFDPSPAPDQWPFGRSWWIAVKEFVSKYTLPLQLNWYKYVMGYNDQSQRSVLAFIGATVRGFFVQFVRDLRSLAGRLQLLPGGKLRPVAITVYLVGIGYLLFGLRRYIVLRRRRILAGLARSLTPEKRRAAAAYADMLFAYARHGTVRKPKRKLAAQLTKTYQRTRFGGRPFPRTDEKHYRETLKKLARMLRG
jgi:transglutaminase-like putative cysteine protease